MLADERPELVDAEVAEVREAVDGVDDGAHVERVDARELHEHVEPRLVAPARGRVVVEFWRAASPRVLEDRVAADALQC